MQADPENLDNRREEILHTEAKQTRRKTAWRPTLISSHICTKCLLLKDRIVMGVIESLLILGRTNPDTKEFVQYFRLETKGRAKAAPTVVIVQIVKCNDI